MTPGFAWFNRPPGAHPKGKNPQGRVLAWGAFIRAVTTLGSVSTNTARAVPRGHGGYPGGREDCGPPSSLPTKTDGDVWELRFDDTGRPEVSGDCPGEILETNMTS